jgi:hypothetical protein
MHLRLLYYTSRARAQSYKHQRMLSEPGLPVWNAGENILCARGSRIISFEIHALRCLCVVDDRIEGRPGNVSYESVKFAQDGTIELNSINISSSDIYDKN